jgi:hypothetical protein
MVARTPVISFVVLISAFGCSGQKETPAVPPTVATGPKRPAIVLTVEPPTDPKAVSAGSALGIVCKVTVESGGFEPVLVIFQVEEPKYKAIETYSVRESNHADNTFVFRYNMKVPKSAGRCVVDAKVIGVDPTLPSNEPAQAPAADGTKAKEGARAQFSAPSLEILVKK